MLNRWYNIFKDDNEWNEKTIVGFISFALMILYIFVYLLSRPLGFEFELNDMIFDSLVTITLGSFGIAEVSKTAASWQRATMYNVPEDKGHDINVDTGEKDQYLDSEQ